MERALSIIIDLGLMTEDESSKYRWEIMNFWDNGKMNFNRMDLVIDIFFPFTSSRSGMEYVGNRNLSVNTLLCGKYNSERLEIAKIIGEYNFKIISKTRTWEFLDNGYLVNKIYVKLDGLLINIESEINSEKRNFKLWRTSGLWRLLDVVDEKGELRIFKGYHDYVQQSMIHCELQNFINMNIDNIPYHYNTVRIGNKRFRCLTLLSELQTVYDNRIHELTRELEDEDRIVVMKPFWDLQTTMVCGMKSKDYTYSPKKKIAEFSEILKKYYDVDGNDCIGNYSQILNKLVFNGSLNRVKLTTIRPASQSEEGPQDVYLYYTYSQIQVKKSRHTFSNRIRRVSNAISNQTSVSPFLITPIDVSITCYGLYSKYIPSGIFVCKNYDYISQSHISELQNQISDISIYIGDRHDPTLFPFSEVDLKLECPTLGGTRKKYKKKTNKRYDRKKIRAFRRIRTSP